jgi:hypothetical protein
MIMQTENSQAGLDFCIRAIQTLVDKWQELDPKGTGEIPVEKLMTYLMNLKAPFGFN